ncbi:MAG: hypothetical protein MJ014_00060 [Methanocorpusculum sp.]|nr:hypothetical protein [Methanocorpusculum sp.]
MVDKLTNINANLDPTTETFKDSLNSNFTVIKEKVGLRFISPPIQVTISQWNDAKFDVTTYQYDVNDPDKTRNEDCRRVAARAFLRVNVPDPKANHVTYTDHLFLPYVENTDANIEMLMEIADCGVDLLDCSQVLNDMQSGQSYANLMLRAVVRKPTMDLKFNFVLF